VEGASTTSDARAIARNGSVAPPCVKKRAVHGPPIPTGGRIVAAPAALGVAFQADWPWPLARRAQLDWPPVHAGFGSPRRVHLLKKRAPAAYLTPIAQRATPVTIRLAWALARAQGLALGLATLRTVRLRIQRRYNQPDHHNEPKAGSGLQDGEQSSFPPCPRPGPRQVVPAATGQAQAETPGGLDRPG